MDRPGFHCVSPAFRYDTRTSALRLASPSIAHSKPRLIRVGWSTTNSPGLTRISGVAALGRSPRHRNIRANATAGQEHVRMDMAASSGIGASLAQGIGAKSQRTGCSRKLDNLRQLAGCPPGWAVATMAYF